MSTVKIQLPIDKDVRDALAKRAEDLGFDSIQAYIRYWAKAEVDGRRVDHDADDWGEPSPEAVARIEASVAEVEAERKAGTLKTFSNVEDALDHLHSLWKASYSPENLRNHTKNAYRITQGFQGNLMSAITFLWSGFAKTQSMITPSLVA